MEAAVAGHVDLLDRGIGAGDERLGDGAPLPGEGEDGAVVVAVGVAVEHPGAGSGVESRPQRGDPRGVAALAEVGSRQQH
jgi:hypothetical protein